MPVFRDQRVLFTCRHVLATDNALIRPNILEEVTGVACPSTTTTFLALVGRHVCILALSKLCPRRDVDQ